MADFLKRPYDEPRNATEQQRINLAATLLCRKMANLTWADREAGLNEWANLVDALNLKIEEPTQEAKS